MTLTLPWTVTPTDDSKRYVFSFLPRRQSADDRTEVDSTETRVDERLVSRRLVMELHR